MEGVSGHIEEIYFDLFWFNDNSISIHNCLRFLSWPGKKS